MKRYLNRLLFVVMPFAVTYAIAYLIGAFVGASWDPAQWEQNQRIVTAMIGNVYGFALWGRLEWEFK